MEQRRNKRQTTPENPADRTGRGGFTLIEVMVVIVIMGVLTSLISVNWSSFMRHQELRQDAINLHKEIIALKARAIEQGQDPSSVAMITFAKTDANTYTIKWDKEEEVTTSGVTVVNIVHKSKTITLNNGVTISAPDPANVSGFATDMDITSNNWIGTDPDDPTTNTITAIADNLNAFKDGMVLVTSNKANARYCIRKDNSNIRPTLWHQSTDGGRWTQM